VTVLVVVGWVIIGIPSMFIVSFAGSRLLGAKRGWMALLGSGIIGWLAALALAGEISQWRWQTLDMILLTLVLGTILTMIMALALDFLSPVGSLATGDQAGLIKFRNPMTWARSRKAEFDRYRQILKIGRENGLVGLKIDRTELPDGVRRTLEESGGIFVKLGQVASTRTDVLPEAWCTELAKLQSGAEPAPEAQVKAMLETEIDDSMTGAFASFDWEPIASASIAQVYRATLLDGTPVVVKVRRPQIENRMAIDRVAVLQLAGLIERHTQLGLAVRPVDLAQEFLDNVAEELDFRIEADNAHELAAGLANFDGVRIPEIYSALSGQAVLTEEMVDGVSIADTVALLAAGRDPQALADRLLRSFLTQIFEVGIFHADPHPGNILVDEEGTIVLIDLGAVGRLSPGQRRATLEMMVAATNADAHNLRQVLTQMVVVDERTDLRVLDQAIERMLARDMRAGQGVSASALQDLAVVMGQFGLRLPDWMTTLIRTLVTLEGTLLDIDGDFSLVAAATEHAGDYVGLRRPGGMRATVEDVAMTEMPRLRRLPERVDTILGQVATGRLSTRISLFADERNEQVISRLVNRVALSILAAAIGIGSVILLSVRIGPHFASSISINEVLGYVGLASAAVLSMRVIAGIIRDGQT
jgi:ubiquinone biosynthesis protein